MSNSLVPGLLVAQSHRLEDLTAIVVKVIETYPLAPLEEETVLVQSNGISQWLKIELAKASGIASMLNITLPARFVWKAYRTILGNDIPKVSPFDKERLSWRIMRVLPGLLKEYRHSSQQEFSALEHYLRDASAEHVTPDGEINERKLFQLSTRIADLFDQYQNYRADWLDHWAQGQRYLNTVEELVPNDNQWQPLLWQALVADIGAEALWTNRAKLHKQFIIKTKQLRALPPGMPKRLIIFGISSLPQQTLEVLDALKHIMQIVLCVHNPCKHYWANIVDGKEAMREALSSATKKRHPLKAGMQEDIEDSSLHLHVHPLLASWGKQGRDYIHLLDLYDDTLEKQGAVSALKFEIFDETPPQNRLQQLQNDILQLRPLHETREVWNVETTTTADDSIQFHICHSIQREIEVLHDQLLAAFEQNKELAPRDIMVMVPDVTAYAPHIDAVFGRFDFNDLRRIPYTIADQGQRHLQPLLVALEQLLSIEQAKITQADVLSILNVPAVQKRFDIDAEELVQIQRWLDEAGARWGLNAEQRALFGMPSDEATNSWWFGLQRMVFGYAMGRPENDKQQRWQDIEPYHEVGGLSADAVGKLGLLIAALNSWWDFSRKTYCLSEWSVAAERLLAQLFKPEELVDITLVAQLQQQLLDVQVLVTESGFTEAISLVTFKESWLSRIDQPNLNQRFLAGSVNFATLMPMRAIPFKHIYVLGMSDDAYPRRQSAIDFDLMHTRYRPGDRSRRDDDRYLFLEALLSAREKFYVSWVGRSARDNSEWPPSVLVAQLREHLAKGWCPTAVKAKDFLAAITTEHKLQPFHPKYLTEGSGLFTYATEWQAARNAALVQQEEPTLTPWQPEQEQLLQVNLNALQNFMREPARPFFNERLNTYFSSEERQTQDSETFTLDGLQQWQLNNQLLQESLTFFSAQLTAGTFTVLENLQPLAAIFNDVFARLAREGWLGIGVMSDNIKRSTLQRVSAQLIEVSNLLQDAKPVADELLTFQCSVDTENKTVAGDQKPALVSVMIEDRATQLFKKPDGEILQIYISASECKAKHRFLPYLKHLLLSTVAATKPDLNKITTYALFRKGKDETEIKTLPPVNSSDAQIALTQLLTLYIESLSKPTGVIGELALDWLGNYWKALNGKLKEGNKNLPAFPPHEAAAEAHKRLVKSTDADADTLQNYPYAARVNSDLSLLCDNADFTRLINMLYAPMVRGENGLPIKLELPAIENNAIQGGA
ncbi:exodeoxyribonuclease V subunit gamma [Alishewanella sp. d11]|uniref:exodeoxyribonuclease V subunit gamma n=1 Tax=Alishewanella sp. d11 TaxID=3414030 RepID=UPI003BF8A134